MPGSVYKVTGPDGKIYIGVTKRSPVTIRWREHVKQASYGSDHYFHKALRKHSSDKFTWEVIWEGPVEELAQMECEFIEEYDCMIPKGYNSAPGGNGLMEQSEEINTKRHDAMMAINDQNFPEWPTDIKPPFHITRYKNTAREGTKTWHYRGYRIWKHPKCSQKAFADKTKTFHENFTEAVVYLNGLNDGSIVHKKRPKLPPGIQYRGEKGSTKYYGFKVFAKDINGKRIHTFKTSNWEPTEALLQKALEWQAEQRSTTVRESARRFNEIRTEINKVIEPLKRLDEVVELVKKQNDSLDDIHGLLEQLLKIQSTPIRKDANPIQNG